MSKRFHTVRLALIIASLAAGPFVHKALAAAPATTTANPDCCSEVRKAVASMSHLLGTTPDKVSYIGLDGKPVTQTAFYQMLSSNPKQEWELKGSLKHSSEEPSATGEIIIKLKPKSK